MTLPKLKLMETAMTANRDIAEHAITETLNGMQLGRPNLQCQLDEMRHADPRHYLENLRLMEKITDNYKDFPHCELHNAELEAESSAQGRILAERNIWPPVPRDGY